MSYEIDPQYLIDTLHECVEVESPVGYYPEVHAWLRDTLADLGYEMTVDNKATAYVRVPGKSGEKTVCIGAHLDTIGLVVRGFNDDGTLRVRQLGGINYASIEGETCLVHCRDGRTVAGQVICNHHSVHVWAEAKTDARTEDTMSVSLIADVKSPGDARALGVTEGAMIGIDPHFEAFDNGYVVSRHIDDKASVAVLPHLRGDRPRRLLGAGRGLRVRGRGHHAHRPRLRGNRRALRGSHLLRRQGPLRLGPHQHADRLRGRGVHRGPLDHAGLLPLLH